MRHIIALAISIASINCCFADPDFAGTYHCKGYDPYIKKAYTGKIVIKPQNTVYSLKMQYDTGEISNGTAGLYDDHSIAVVFQSVKNLKKVGLERYAYSDDKKQIEGYWVYLGKDKLGTEICVKDDDKK